MLLSPSDETRDCRTEQSFSLEVSQQGSQMTETQGPRTVMNADPIKSFWMAGFEGADHLNAHALPLDMVGVSGHAEQVEDDYRLLREVGLRSVRESIGWRISEQTPGKIDLSRALRFAQAANRNNLQILWTLMHYGTPSNVSVMDDSFCDRFVEFASTVARTLGPYSEAAPVYTPINEISFFAWAVCETSGFHPYVGNRSDPRFEGSVDGYVVKKRLVDATLKAMAAMRREDPRSRFLHIDPVVHIVAPQDASRALRSETRRFRSYQWQAWDMIAGLSEPQLGGSLESLDLVGLNHYHTAQWEFGTGRTLDWLGSDLRRRPFSRLIEEAWRRYRRPIVIAETGHVDAGRARWLLEIAAEVKRALRKGALVEGVCLYPIVARPDWDNDRHWHRSGLWDATPSVGDAIPDRVDGSWRTGRFIDADYADALSRVRAEKRPGSRNE